MIKRDFHGYYLDDAIHEVELIIGDVRNRRVKETAEFITGHGAIQKGVIELLNDYHLDIHHDMGNSGIIIVTIE